MDSRLETKNVLREYAVPGWPPEVSRNVSNYIDFQGKTTFILGPKLGIVNMEGMKFYHIWFFSRIEPA